MYLSLALLSMVSPLTLSVVVAAGSLDVDIFLCIAIFIRELQLVDEEA